ncbi:MAG TPA: FKBP-type peptidyl-prolyl cis-trans isomerase [Cyclobacteriaceae bacterium]|nr:FKBP-type peptidyl-prolyl cis-trans isomerase [Cyclobacteriaceae bacterium]
MKNWINLFLGLAIVGFLVSCNKSSDPNAQLNKELKVLDNYLSTHHTGDYVVYDNYYGNRIQIDSVGGGLPPHSGQTVTITYEARLFPDTLTVFDSKTITSKIDDISVYGLKVGISYLFQGSKATLYIPSPNAFGKEGTTNVPPNTSVIYNVSLDTVIRTADQFTQFKADTAKVKHYIDSLGVNATYHPSGFWYTMDAIGTGDYPKPFDVANFHYKLVLISNGASLQESDLTNSIFGLDIDALKIGMLLMREGGKATFYIPSGLAYGTAKVGSIPANGNVVFTIQLNTLSNQ